MQPALTPALFGLENSNRDFTKKEFWGKNQFNNAFPAALACYMHSQNLEAVYLWLDSNLMVIQKTLAITTLLGLTPLSSGLYFNFEAVFTPYAPLSIGLLPRADLVTQDISQQGNPCLKGLEVKLTALPDEQTFNTSDESLYGCEIVTRPDTIVYLALSIATNFSSNIEQAQLFNLLDPICGLVKDWTDPQEVFPLLTPIIKLLNDVLLIKPNQQKPLVIQPIWKTIGKTSILAEYCFDLFVWSDAAFTRLFVDAALRDRKEITRFSRTVFWLVRMLYDYAKNGKFNQKLILDKMTFNTKNDKAFALGGRGTNKYMRGNNLTQPRLAKEVVKEIILGKGQGFLSPERRLDAAILSTPGLFL
jgi:HindVP restriction endonuclease